MSEAVLNTDSLQSERTKAPAVGEWDYSMQEVNEGSLHMQLYQLWGCFFLMHNFLLYFPPCQLYSLLPVLGPSPEGR